MEQGYTLQQVCRIFYESLLKLTSREVSRSSEHRHQLLLVPYAMLVEVDDLGCQVDSEITSLLDEFGFAGVIENPLKKRQLIGFECLKETNMIFKHRRLTAPLPSTEIVTAPYPTFCSAWKRPPAYRSREVFSPGEHRQQLLLSAYAVLKQADYVGSNL